MADDPTDPATEPEVADAEVAVGEATEEAAGEVAAAPSAAAAEKADATVVRKKVVSKRVTPKGGTQGVKAAPKGPTAARSSKSSSDDGDLGYSKRYTPPAAKYAQGPSPWWVPALMFGLLIIGALIIMLNYMGAFGDAQNIRLVIGLAFILGGIVTATQYR